MKKIKLFYSLLVLGFMMIFASTIFAQWVYIPPGIPAPVNYPSISVCAPNTAWVATGTSNLGRVWRTTDGGVNWTQLTAPSGPEPYCIWAIDVNTAFIGDGGAGGGLGGNAKVFKTTNGGTTWTMVLSTGGSGGFINGIVFSRTTPSFGIAQSDPPNGLGQPYWIAKTTDGGNTWALSSPQPPGISAAASAQNSIVVIDNQFYGFGLNAGAARVYFTSNGGTSWTIGNLGVGVSPCFVSGFAVKSDKTAGIGAPSNSLPNIARSTNGCVSWTAVNTGAGVSGYCVMQWIHGSSLCYLSTQSGTAGCIKRSTNDGATWTQMTTGGIVGGSPGHHFDYFKEANNVVHLYLVASDGSIIRYRDSSLVVGINVNNGSTPTEYKLEQNFPNPFNPTTTINYALPKASVVTIKVYDMLGNEIMDLVNEQKPAGNHSATVDASGLASGVYFYTIKAGDFAASKKMTLVK